MVPGDDDPLTSTESTSTEDEYDGGEIIVTGTRPKTYDPGTGGDPGTGTPGDGDTGGTGGGSGEPPPEENDCPDREAMEAADEIKKDNYEDYYSESTSIIYKASDGSIQHTPVITTGTTSIGYDVYDAILEVNGISWSQVIGMVHNHPGISGTTETGRDVNRYPSGDRSYTDGDWGFGQYAIDRGASPDLSIYVMDTEGKLREFKWSDRDFYAGLTRDQKDDGVGLPGGVEGCGSS